MFIWFFHVCLFRIFCICDFSISLNECACCCGGWWWLLLASSTFDIFFFSLSSRVHRFDSPLRSRYALVPLFLYFIYSVYRFKLPSFIVYFLVLVSLRFAPVQSVLSFFKRLLLLFFLRFVCCFSSIQNFSLYPFGLFVMCLVYLEQFHFNIFFFFFLIHNSIVLDVWSVGRSSLPSCAIVVILIVILVFLPPVLLCFMSSLWTVYCRPHEIQINV